jgi:maltose-binding protein MalE
MTRSAGHVHATAASVARSIGSVAALAAVALLGACGGGQPATQPSASIGSTTAPSSGATSLLIWADPTLAPAVEQLAAAHTAATGVAVTVEPVATSTILATLPALAPAGQGPDLFMGRSEWVGALTDRGLLAPVDISVQEPQFRPVALDAFTYQQKVYGVPVATENVALFRNTELAQTPPESIEEMATTGLALAEDDKVDVPIALPVGPAGDAYHWYPLYSASGGYIFGQDIDGGYTTESMGVGEPGSVRAAKDLAELAEQEAIDADLTLTGAITAFADGRTAYLIAGPEAVAQARAAQVPFTVEAIPGFASTTRPLSQSLVSAPGFMLSAFARNAALARDFLSTTAMTTKAMDTIFAASQQVPAWNASYTSAATDAVIKAFGQVADSSVPNPNLAVMDQVWPILSQAEVDIIEGEPPARTMEAAGAAIQAAVDAG